MNSRFIVGSNSFFDGYYPDFKSKDIDVLIIEDEPKLYKDCLQLHVTGKCVFMWRRMSKDEFIEKSLERGLGMEIGKFLVKEFYDEIGMTIDDLKRLKPLIDKIDERHLYEKVIYDSYIENDEVTLTKEQRDKAYNVYKENKAI